MGKPLNVLIVEDNEDDALLLVRRLGKEGFDVDHERVEDADAMTAALADKPWDAILCDYRLPNFSAQGALAVLKESGKEVPFLVVSGTIGEEHAADLMTAGAHDLILKGNLSRLGPALERTLRDTEVRRERNRAVQELRISEQRFRDFASAASDWFWEMGPDLRFTFLSGRGLESAGLSPDRFIGKTRWEAAGVDCEADEHWRRHKETLEAHEPFRDFRYDSTLSDGRRIYFTVSGVPIFDADGAFQGYRGTGTDITEMRETEQRLQQAHKMETVGNLTGGIAHDFNNILGVVLGNLQLLNRRIKDDERLSTLVAAAIDAVHRGADLTRQLLAFSRRQELEPQILDVNALVGGMDTMLRRTLGEAVEIRTTLGDGLGQVKADPAQLETALLNLAINARDAMPDGGRLIIETSNVDLDRTYLEKNPYANPGPHVCISVCDTGTGIPDTHLHQIFEPFFTTKEVGKGTGLGLSMVYGFVKQSGGHINVYSEEGHGTRFRVYLPRTDEAATEPGADADADGDVPPRGSETVLLVEDNPEFRRTAALILEDLGYRVVAEADGPSALKALEAATDVDILFADMIMPGGVNGHELAERARELRPGLAVLLTSGYPRGAFNEGRRFPLLSKPYNDTDLARAVRAALDRRSDPEA